MIQGNYRNFGQVSRRCRARTGVLWMSCADRCPTDAVVLQAACVTESQSGCLYITLSFTELAYKKLMAKSRALVENNDRLLRASSSTMLKKLEAYESLVCSDMCKLCRAFDPRFCHDPISDGPILRRYILIPPQSPSSTNPSCNESSLLSQLITDNEPSLYCNSDEIEGYLRATISGDISVDPLLWWKMNTKRFPNIARFARNLLSVQSSSVASESAFSTSGALVTPSRAGLGDESIEACMLVNFWMNLLKKN